MFDNEIFEGNNICIYFKLRMHSLMCGSTN